MRLEQVSPPSWQVRTGSSRPSVSVHAHLLAPPTWTHLLLTDKKLVSPQRKEAILPDLPEDSLATELSDPAHLVRRWH